MTERDYIHTPPPSLEDFLQTGNSRPRAQSPQGAGPQHRSFEQPQTIEQELPTYTSPPNTAFVGYQTTAHSTSESPSSTPNLEQTIPVTSTSAASKLLFLLGNGFKAAKEKPKRSLSGLAIGALAVALLFQQDTIKSAAATIIPKQDLTPEVKAEQMHIPAPDCFDTTYQLNTAVRASMYVKTTVIDSSVPSEQKAVIEAKQKAAKDPAFEPIPGLTLKTGFFQDVPPEQHPQVQFLPKLDVFELTDPKEAKTASTKAGEGDSKEIDFVERLPIAEFSGVVDVSVCLKPDAAMENAVTQKSDEEVLVNTSDFMVIVNEGGATLDYEQYPPSYENIGQESYYTGKEMTRLQKLLAPKSTFDDKKKQLSLGNAYNPKILEYFRLEALKELNGLDNGKELENYSRQGIEKYLEKVTERDLDVEYSGSFVSPVTVYSEKLEAKGPLTTDVMFKDFVADMKPIGLEESK